MSSFWSGKRVFITGQTGFKGAWLAFWLSELGAKLSGIALPPSTTPNLHDLLRIDTRGDFSFVDLNNTFELKRRLQDASPEIIIHMAAQALVRPSYQDPVTTFTTNVIGTASVLNYARDLPDLKAILVVTTDKIYEPLTPPRPYREDDQLGGHDPYSTSKACAELVVASFRRSFFDINSKAPLIATVRAGNVIGGGDWSQDRIIPDIIRGGFSADETIQLRNRHSIRPWQHVFDVLHAYLLIAERLYHHDIKASGSWNIGPLASEALSVQTLAEKMMHALGRGNLIDQLEAGAPHEAPYLMLDTAKARSELQWAPRLTLDAAIQATADWYKAWHAGEEMQSVSRNQLEHFVRRA